MHNSLSPFIAIARRGIPCDASCEKKPSRMRLPISIHHRNPLKENGLQRHD